MHWATFPLKRAHHETLKLLRPIAARHNLTPARFDLLLTLRVPHRCPAIFPYQVAIAKVLRLSKSTICKMVAALEKAGFVRSEENYYDRRYHVLKLTTYGRRCLRRVLKELRRREVDRTLLRSFIPILGVSRARRSAFLHRFIHKVRRFNVALDRTFEPNLYRVPDPDFPWDTP
jgi:DNA-binding MarR family transcriptional regulator